jgi:AcrR family transcriptional regulator
MGMTAQDGGMADITPVGTRRQVLATALELFSTQGYEGTSLRQIAERLGMTKAAVYYHFPAKEHLIVELTRPFLNDLAAFVSTAREHAGGDARQRHIDLLQGYLDLLLAHHAVVNLLARDPGTLPHPDVGQRATRLVGALEGELAGPDAGDDDHIRVSCAMGALNSIAALPADRAGAARPIILAAAIAALASGEGEPAAVRRPRQPRSR